MGWRDAVARGWRVIPVEDKKATIDAWPARGTLSPDEPQDDNGYRRPWPADWPDDREYAILTGPVSGLLVLDIDVKANGPANLAAWEVVHGKLPDTYRVRTGSGGEHRYFGFPPELSNVSLKFHLCPGVEVKGLGRYVVGAGSPHPSSGGRYQVADDLPVVDCPRHLARGILEAAHDEHPERRERVDPAEVLAGVEQGQQNNKLFAYTCRLRRIGVAEAEALFLVERAMAACVPPYRKETAQEMVDRVWQTYEGRPAQQSDNSTWKVSTASEDDFDLPVVGPAFLLRTDGEALFYPASINYMFGEPGSVKSWISLLACKQAIEEGYSIFYFDFEDRRSRVFDRMRWIGTADELLSERFFYARPREAIHIDVVEEALLDHSPSLVVLDGVVASMDMEGLASDKGQDVSAWYDRVPRRMVSAGAGVIMTDHVVKDPESRGKYGIGSERKLALVDGVAYSVRIAREEQGLKIVRLHISKDRMGMIYDCASGDRAAEVELKKLGEAEYTVTAKPPTAGTTASGRANGFSPTWYMEKVSRFVEENPGCSHRAIDAAVSGKTTYRRQAVEQLVAQGYVRQEGTDRRMAFTSLRPYREEEDG